ncbi:hypothetical protein N7493_008905 [Penicillium malachiteum]|uniref:AMP-dependent synthetase/ligase domain-containing protein n=1 Tax=Penicillium malachiteum TaxID=1324776 RepID=A0AAD6HFM0_9EURO|nr:hypothetical protein N7493_008905 [Penicillium malachiteum]
MSSASTIFPLPGVEHGKRVLTSVIEQRAESKDDVWVSLPVDETDLSLGFKDITFWQFKNAANQAANWLNQNLSASKPFECFAYAGPKDLRYPILAAAAAKVQKVMVLPSPLVTPAAQSKIFAAKGCTIDLRPEEMAESVAGILKDENASHMQTVTVPPLEQFLNETEATPVNYSKTWEEGQDDPWLRHGLVITWNHWTGNPKSITYSQSMMAVVDTAAALPAVIGPAGPPNPATIAQVIKYGRVEGALLPPVLIDALCLSPDGIEALKGLKYIHYAGAPLSAKSGELLAPHVKLVPSIGSTECSGYFMVMHCKPDAWGYLAFQEHAGAKFEQQTNDLHELVFVRDPSCEMQMIFKTYPNRDRFETNDLWVEHPTEKGLWKIIGRSDDYVCFSHGDGMHASLLESEITAHPRVKNVLIGGNGRSAPILLVEFVEDSENGSRETQLESLRPYVEKLNARCHQSVQVSLDKVIIASKQKPFLTTSKGSVARLQTLRLYGDEIDALFP